MSDASMSSDEDSRGQGDHEEALSADKSATAPATMSLGQQAGHNPSKMATTQAAGSAPVPAHLISRTVLAEGQKSTLPAEKVFPIQVGTELFRLSGASISSDGPSYFTQWFEEQIRQNKDSGGVRTLYIDRDPITFRDIARHLQGYYIKPVDGAHFVRLFADAQFYSLPRFISQLFESEIFIQIGEQHFQIPKDLFSDPGNSPNFFSLGFAVFFSTPGDVFPGLDKRGLLRPPPINPPYVPNRSAEIFAQLLHVLRGYPLEIKNEIHRAQLLRDCRYFHFRGLEQKIIAHSISYNLERERAEICLRLEDLKPSGISFQPDVVGPPKSDHAQACDGWIFYARPFVDERSYELIMEISCESLTVDLNDMRAEIHSTAKPRIGSLFSVIANKMDLPPNVPLGLIAIGSLKRSQSPGFSSLSDERVKVRFEPSSDLVLDGAPFEVDWNSVDGQHFRNGPSNEVEKTPSATGTEETAQSAAPHCRRKGVSASPRTARHGVPISTSTGDGPPASRKRKLDDESFARASWTIRNGQWRLRIQKTADPARSGYEVVFIAVKIDAFSTERGRNAQRPFLSKG